MADLKIVCISDVHARWNKLFIEQCDILISCGDYSGRGELHLTKNYHEWLNNQPAKHIISIPGNHELGVEENFELHKDTVSKVNPRCHFLSEGPLEIEGVKIWCSSVTPYFCNWAWNRFRGEDIQRHWDLIPDDTQILVTHGPPYGILDESSGSGKVGCKDLLNTIKTRLKSLKYHVFGHLHESSRELEVDGVKYINASICNDYYRPAYKPKIIIDNF